LIDARRIAQIAIFIFGLTQLGALIQFGTALSFYLGPGEHDPVGLVVAVTYALFVLSLLFLSRGWASLINVPGTVSEFSELARDDLLRVGVALLGLYFLVTGVSGVVAGVVQWFNVGASPAFQHPVPVRDFLEVTAFVRGLAGAALLFWGTNVVALVQWARSLGSGKGAA
jgi:hypothetical protein